MSENERGGNRRPFRRRRRDGERRRDSERRQDWKEPKDGRSGKKREFFDRPRWTAPEAPRDPIPLADCSWCGKPIRDMSTALQDRATGGAVHFDCVLERIAEGETFEAGDTLAYIGGGRFGIVHLDNPQNARNFRITKILEWEDKEHRAEWRKTISDHYSMT
jgi:hypothetical protein